MPLLGKRFCRGNIAGALLGQTKIEKKSVFSSGLGLSFNAFEKISRRLRVLALVESLVGTEVQRSSSIREQLVRRFKISHRPKTICFELDSLCVRRFHGEDVIGHGQGVGKMPFPP